MGEGRYYYGARYYCPEIGRFIQPDTVLDGLNRYAYCWNNPMNYVDPTGNATQPDIYNAGSRPDGGTFEDDLNNQDDGDDDGGGGPTTNGLPPNPGSGQSDVVGADGRTYRWLGSWYVWEARFNGTQQNGTLGNWWSCTPGDIALANGAGNIDDGEIAGGQIDPNAGENGGDQPGGGPNNNPDPGGDGDGNGQDDGDGEIIVYARNDAVLRQHNPIIYNTAQGYCNFITYDNGRDRGYHPSDDLWAQPNNYEAMINSIPNLTRSRTPKVHTVGYAFMSWGRSADNSPWDPEHVCWYEYDEGGTYTLYYTNGTVPFGIENWALDERRHGIVDIMFIPLAPK